MVKKVVFSRMFWVHGSQNRGQWPRDLCIWPLLESACKISAFSLIIRTKHSLYKIWCHKVSNFSPPPLPHYLSTLTPNCGSLEITMSVKVTLKTDSQHKSNTSFNWFLTDLLIFCQKPEVSAGSRSPSSVSNIESAAPYNQSIQSFVGQPNIESLGSF